MHSILLLQLSTILKQGVINVHEVEYFLQATTRQVTSKEYTPSTLSKVGTQLVELVKTGFSHNCPSTDGFKFVVHATVQEQWGHGVGLPAEGQVQVGGSGDWVRDKVVCITHYTDKISVCLVVFFVLIEE